MGWRQRVAGADFVRIFGFAAAAVLAGVSAHGAAHSFQQRGESSAIEVGKTLEGVLSGGRAARYALPLDADRAATLVVMHRKVDLLLRVFEEDVEPEIEIASDGPEGELRLRLHARESRVHLVEIAAAYPKGAEGSYTLWVEDPRGASVADRQLSDADRHDSRAGRLRSAASYAAALPEAEQALAAREKTLGPDAPAVARSLLLLARLNDAMAQFDIAGKLYLRARGVLDRISDRHELLTAEILDSYAAHCILRGNFAEAEPLVQDALATRERILGPNHVRVAASLGTLADLHHERGNLQESGRAAERALEIAARMYGPADAAMGDFINRVARSQLAQGNYGRAERLYRESLEARETDPGGAGLAAAQALGGLARTALLANDNVRAEELHLQSVGIREKIFGPDHPQVADDLFNLALIQYRRRDYTTALELYGRALSNYENAFGRSHPRVALILNNIGLVYWRLGDYTRAGEFYQRSVEMVEELFGADSLRVANTLANLGIVAKETGDYAVAEKRYRRALAIKEKHLGPDHPELIAVVESLGILYRDRGDYAPAEAMFRRSLGITEASLGPEHPFVARHLKNVLRLNWAMGRLEQAFADLQRATAIDDRILPLNLSLGSERQKLAYSEPLLNALEQTITFAAQRRDHPGSRDLAVTTLLQRKGRVFDALADNLNAFRNRARPEDRPLLDRLVQVTSDLAATVMSDSMRLPSAERQRRALALAAERERLEIEIHRRSAGYVGPWQPVTLTIVQNALPRAAALLEFAIYRPFDPRASFESGRQFGAPRYIVYVVRTSGEPVWKDLGPAEEIDPLLDRFRRALADPGRQDVIRVATDLHGKLIGPLRPLWGDASHLLISPDGPLNLIPFEALRGPSGRYLVEDAAISYVTTGRDLVRMLAPRPQARGTVVFADAAFGEPPQQQVARATPPATPRIRRRSVIAADDLSSAYFAPLAGTASEARRIQTLFPDVELMLGARATETALKNLHVPRILHIATHGFFLQDGGSPAARRSDDVTRTTDATAPIDNPLLRSGLAFAGANLRRTGGDDGILTALEAANLNLWGTKLVTLSACDTGIGVVRNGEGVYGLRRAFFLAGAETLVMSLWPVSDLITRQMMTGYYAGLKQGLGRGAALRRTQLEMLKRPGRAHPFYWASFIQAGEWASVDGRR